MSKLRIESYIPIAIDVLNEKYPNGVISSAYNGYISSFGASIVQSGLKPTLALFENENNKDKTKQDKSELTKIILKILDKNYNDSSLLTYVLKSPNEEAINKQKIMDIATAIKFGIRTFSLEKDKKDE